jgi:hypothetical protein
VACLKIVAPAPHIFEDPPLKALNCQYLMKIAMSGNRRRYIQLNIDLTNFKININFTNFGKWNSIAFADLLKFERKIEFKRNVLSSSIVSCPAV